MEWFYRDWQVTIILSVSSKIFFIIWEYFEKKMFQLNTNIVYSKILSILRFFLRFILRLPQSLLACMVTRLLQYQYFCLWGILRNCHKSTADDKQNKKDGYNSKKILNHLKNLKKRKTMTLGKFIFRPQDIMSLQAYMPADIDFNDKRFSHHNF